jgi:hypothetical protein
MKNKAAFETEVYICVCISDKLMRQDAEIINYGRNLYVRAPS